MVSWTIRTRMAAEGYRGGREAGRRRTDSHKILLRDGRAELVVFGDEIVDELVHPHREDAFDAGAREPCQHVAGKPLARHAPAVCLGDEVEVADEEFVAVRERARHLAVEDEEVRHEP